MFETILVKDEESNDEEVEEEQLNFVVTFGRILKKLKRSLEESKNVLIIKLIVSKLSF